MATETDVLICGSGSAGLCAAVWLARLGIKFIVLEKSDGPLRIGQADGIQCRTVEVFESFDLDGELIKNAYWVNEVCFWSAEKDQNSGTENRERITRTGRTADVKSGISWKPHVIMSQAHLNALLLGDVKKYSGQDVEYGVSVKNVSLDSSTVEDPHAISATVTAEKDGTEVIYKAKYILGCDGAHSIVRKSLGYKMVGDTSDAVWGVMDVYPETDFPDIRKKVTIRSKAGNLLIIPREGGSMVRLYLELPHGTVAKSVQLEDLQNTAKQILSQYKLDIKHTYWWSAYTIGQRLADHFSKDNRIFLTGDSCHTHSPKAGQGMNLSLQDGYNIGWKLAAVLKGQSSPRLLRTYNLEREKTAADLIAFDREFTKLFSSAANREVRNAAQTFTEFFIKSGRYTAGITTAYDDSMITNGKESRQDLAKNIIVGMRFNSAQVVRFCDARAMQIAKALQSNGRWRVVVFGGDILDSHGRQRLIKFSKELESSELFRRHMELISYPSDIHVEALLVLHGSRVALDEVVMVGEVMIPKVFSAPDGDLGLPDLNKVFIDDESYNYGHGHAYETLGVDPKEGAVVVVRPDQYVSMVTSLHDSTGVLDFFKSVDSI
ncbi:phenol 2-monooxygenase [Tothia fuscella]|uniref:Phenol 2-monooxygenase n=1 Tax=Tothia fuscella TaxID=1048955 RepID=A0A9P4NFQ1_9PEZI|nr:phenol 2-monooxygenase [Tothia fuscella]